MMSEKSGAIIISFSRNEFWKKFRNYWYFWNCPIVGNICGGHLFWKQGKLYRICLTLREMLKTTLKLFFLFGTILFVIYCLATSTIRDVPNISGFGAN